MKLEFLADLPLPYNKKEEAFQNYPLADQIPYDIDPRSLMNIEFKCEQVEIFDIREGGKFYLSSWGFSLFNA